MKNLIVYNIVKHIVILLIGFFLWSAISDSLKQIRVEQMNDFLLMISILLVTVSFANFAFTYEKSKPIFGGEQNRDIPWCYFCLHTSDLTFA